MSVLACVAILGLQAVALGALRLAMSDAGELHLCDE